MTKQLVFNSPEKELLQNLVKGDEETIGSVYDKYATSLLAVIMNITEDMKVAEDVLQNSFVFILQNLEKYPASNQPFFTWMVMITRNIALQTMSSQDENSLNNIQRGNNIVSDNEMYNPEFSNEKIKTKEQKVLELICLKGFTIEKASEILEISEEEVKANLRNELIKFRKNK